MNQNTAEWLEWRRLGLGASDAPIVMGISPYKTRRQLWENKLKLRPDDPESYITELGHKFEPMARAHFSLETGIDLVGDICRVHPEFSFLRASLDGHNQQEQVFAEIKMVGRRKMDWIRENRKPLDEHSPQCQQQFLVTGYERGFYIAYTLDESKTEITEVVHFPILRDQNYIDILFKSLKSFWKLVETQTPPDLEDRDIYEFKDKEILAMAKAWQDKKDQHQKIESELEEMSEKLKALASVHAKVKIGNVNIQKIVRQGNVKWKDIPELKNVDVDKYRGPASSYQQIKVY